MSQQIQITGGAKVRNLEGVLTGTAGVVNSLGINVPSGIPQLDGSGKILVSQLPNSVMEFKGTWDAATNTPTLADGIGNAGDVYLCNVAGTVDFGSGPITFAVGDQVLYSGTEWERASGATGTVSSVAVTESGDALTITGSPITTSGTINIGFAGTSGQYVNGAGNLVTFPTLTGYVPYTGATANVNLGEFDLTADVITGATGSFASSGGSDTFAINHSSGSGIALNITKGGNGEGLYINKTSGTGNAATIIGTLNATTLVKSGGTSSQFLKADGSVDSNTYVTTDTTQTISGAKIFSSIIYANGTVYLPAAGTASQTKLENISTVGVVNFGANSLGFNSNDNLHISSNSKGYAVFAFNNSGTGYTYTLPATTGTIALTSQLTGGTVTSVGLTSSTSGVFIGTTPITTSGTLSFTIATASGLQQGLLSSSDWTTFSSKQPALSGTGFVKISGSTISYDNSTYLTTSAASSTYLPLTGGTLTGDLSIDKSSASLFLKSATGGSNSIGFLVNGVSVGGITVTSTFYQFNNNTSYGYLFKNAAGNNLLSIQDSGSAVFLGSVSATIGDFSSWVKSTGYRLDGMTAGSGALYYNAGANRVTLANYNASGILTFEVNGGATALTLASTGAATFSSSVTGRSYSIVSPNGYSGQIISQGDIFGTAATNLLIQSSTGNGIGFLTNGGTTFNMFINPSGNVGIGTSSPQGILHLSATSANAFFYNTFSNAANRNWAIAFGIGSLGDFNIMSSNAEGGNPITAGTSKFNIQPTGNVGIGTSGPGNFSGVGFTGPFLDIAGILQIKGTSSNGLAAFQLGGDTYRKALIYTPVGTDTPYLAFGVATSGSSSDAAERMRITSGGGVVIGATTTGYKFEVVGGGSYTALFNQSGGNASFPTVTIQHNVTSGTIMLQQYYTGSTDVGRITSNGSTITFSGNALSDARHKENIKPIQNALEAINKIDFVTFNYKENNKQKSAGVTAQQAQTVQGISDFVIDGTDEESYKAFDYNALIGYLGKAIQEQNEIITKQGQAIEELKALIAAK